jgi:hypothetical protein
MSKLFLAAVLAVLLGLLGVMANVVSPKPKEPDPEVKAKMEAAQKQSQDDAIKKQQDQMKSLLNGKQAAKVEEPPQGHLPPPPKGLKTGPKGMAITSDWYQSRPPGDAGIKKLAEEAKAEQLQKPVTIPSSSVKTMGHTVD